MEWNDFYNQKGINDKLTLRLLHMKSSMLFLLIVLTLTGKSNAQKMDSTKRYIRVPAGFLMVLRQGDDIFTQLEKLAETEKILSANISGMGFVNAKFGFFNQKTKEYDPKGFSDVEMASMNGSVAWQKEKVSLHIHGVVTDKNFHAFGGHMLAATVSTGSVEILVTMHDKRLERLMEEPLGANVLNLGN